MLLIPVIDLKGGLAVHARHGQRDDYQPLATRFADNPVPDAVLDGLVNMLSPPAVYIADLDAITARGSHAETIAGLATRHPDTRFVVDHGLRPDCGAPRLLAHSNVDLIVASETLTTLDAYRAVSADIPVRRRILSLDRRAGVPLGPIDLFSDPAQWPEQLIHMELTRVGSELGPDFAGLEALRRCAGEREIYAAGGIRDTRDLARLSELGINYALVGTALHDGRIDQLTIDP